MTAAQGTVFIGTRDALLVRRDGREITHELGGGVELLATSGDGRWVAAQIEGGATVLLDGRTGAIDRTLESVESFGVAAILDRAGDLVVRTSRGTLTVWERTTGDNLLWALEFLQGSYVATFADDGRIEIAGQRLGLIDIPRETRPVADILATIACRVPLRVAGSRLASAPVVCPH